MAEEQRPDLQDQDAATEAAVETPEGDLAARVASLEEQLAAADKHIGATVIPGADGKKGSLFDQVEDMDVEECVKKCVEINAAQAAEVAGTRSAAGSGRPWGPEVPGE